jgi:AhpC/TSA family protein
MRGNVVVLLFSGLQDPQRREGLKALASLAERYEGKTVKVYWVSVNSTSEVTNEQLKSVSNSVPLLRDSSQAAFKRFSGKVAQLPTIVVLDRQGNPFGQPRGGFNPNSDFLNDLASVIDGLLQRS